MCAILTYADAEISGEVFEELLNRTHSRGPDMSRTEKTGAGWLGFNRLAIMGLNEAGMQPFSYRKHKVVCNGEIYGFKYLKG